MANDNNTREFQPLATSRGDQHYNDDRKRRKKCSSSSSTFPEIKKSDEKLGDLQDDPRGTDPNKRITKKASGRGHGRNTESFAPESTICRPDLRIQIGSAADTTYRKPLKHDDVVIVPELFGAEENWDNYYKLIEEMREIQKKDQSNLSSSDEEEKKSDEKIKHNNKKEKRSEWISWHEGAHLITQNPTGSPTYNQIIARLCEYFSIDPNKIGTRFNWYRDSNDWKPFHHDSAAFNPQRARNQNITVGASFGATRELAFIRTRKYEEVTREGEESVGKNDGSYIGEKCKLYFPQTNNGVFSFGRDANIHWKHGVNALHPSEQDGLGRISIILWGQAMNVIEEEGNPPLLGSDGRGPHANNNRQHNSHRRARGSNNNHNNNRNHHGFHHNHRRDHHNNNHHHHSTYERDNYRSDDRDQGRRYEDHHGRNNVRRDHNNNSCYGRDNRRGEYSDYGHYGRQNDRR